ncbi:MAG: hypothetical protein H0X29_05705 [Parachlamydiaceae bacterium]|nr:hypothetical protein [Parachlamydiaceae bacterium]
MGTNYDNENDRNNLREANVATLAQQAPARGSFRSFEDVFRTSYSHGLEAIYNIETVDLKSVRRLNEPSLTRLNQKKINLNPEPLCIFETQLEFDFGDGYRESMDSFVLNEPIQVLKISKHAEKCLYDNGMSTLSMLLKADLTQFVYLRGMGQGHIDEIRQKLNEYISGRILQGSRSIDFYAWMRSLILAGNTKKMHVMLEPFKLSDLCGLSAAENVEVRRLSAEKRHEWCDEMALELISKKAHLERDMKKVADVYVLPWMRRRLGFATQQEILEHLLRISLVPLGAQMIFSFFSEIYFGGRFPLADFLIQNDKNLFFVDQETLCAFDAVVAKAKTYFYKSQLSYTLAELTMLLTKEFALSWQSFPCGFIEKSLRACSCFRVRNAENGQLNVRLA